MAPRIEDFYARVGKRVEEARKKKGFTQDQLGARLSPPMTRASVSNIETGKQRVLAHTLVNLAAALEVRLETLLPPEAKPEPKEILLAQVQREVAAKLPLSKDQARALTRQIGNTLSKGGS